MWSQGASGVAEGEQGERTGTLSLKKGKSGEKNFFGVKNLKTLKGGSYPFQSILSQQWRSQRSGGGVLSPKKWKVLRI